MIAFLLKIRKPFSTIAYLFLCISLLPVVFAFFDGKWWEGLTTAGYALLGSLMVLTVMGLLFYWDYKWFVRLEAESPLMEHLRRHHFVKREKATRWEYSTWYEGIVDGYRIEAKLEQGRGNGFLSKYFLSLSARVANTVEGETYKAFKERNAASITFLADHSVEMYPDYVEARDGIRLRKKDDAGDEVAQFNAFVQALRQSGVKPGAE